MTARKITSATGPIAAIAALVAHAGPAFAEDATRYILERTETGFVRMDQATGDISVCEEQGKTLVCRMAADDRQAYEADIAALEERVAALEAVVGTPAPGVGQPGKGLPSESEFETTLDYMERFFRRFKGLADEFGSGNDDKPATEPDRT